MRLTERRLRTLAGICLALIAASAAAEQGAADGDELYVRFQCWQCHGYVGQGGAAPRVAAKAYPFEAFSRYVRFPNLMPAYPPDLLSDAELRRIYDFVRSIPTPPALDEIEALGAQ